LALEDASRGDADLRRLGTDWLERISPVRGVLQTRRSSVFEGNRVKKMAEENEQ
jgi:hypothetical protein